MIWQAKAFISMLLFVPIFMGPKIMAKSFGVSSEAFTIFLGIGGMTGILSFLFLKGNTGALAVGVMPAAIIIAMGLLFGAAANVLMYQAAAMAPNPGLVTAIINCATIVLFVLAIALGQSAWEDVTIKQLAGIFLAVTGVALITIK